MSSDNIAATRRHPKPTLPEPDQKRKALEQQHAAEENGHGSDLLDEALNDTFPGSDPVSITQPVGEQCKQR